MVNPRTAMNTDTPRTDAWEAASAPYADLINLARQLERELAEAKKKPPCKHEHRTGWAKGAEWDEWCTDCGANTKELNAISAGYF